MSPFSSKAQQRFMYANPSVLGRKALEEWSTKTSFKNLPEKVKPAGKKEKSQ
jgi:hypothetical protein